MKNKLSDLNNYLFEQIENLSAEDQTDEELEKNIKKSEAISEVAKVIITNQSLQLNAAKFAAEYGVVKPESVKLLLGAASNEKKYSREVYLFVLNHASGKTTDQLLEIVNKRFGNIFTASSLKAFKSNHGIKSGVSRGGQNKGKTKLFAPEIQKFIKENAKGLYNKELTDLVNKTFGTSYTVNQIDCYKSNNGIVSGLTGHFEKGHISHNKGKKMSPEQYAKCKATMFKKGNVPHNTVPVGTEVVIKDGYTKVKIAQPDVWAHKHRLIYEKAHGCKVSDDQMVIFLDGDCTNFDIKNLALISRAEGLSLMQQKLRSSDAEVTRAGVGVVRLQNKIKEVKKRGDKSGN